MSAPAAAYTPPVDQPPPLATGNPYGGFWVRLAAYFVDGFIVGLMMMIVMVLWIIAVGTKTAVEYDGVMTLAVVVLGQFYHAYFLSSKRMATPGKRLCGLYVTDTGGHRLSFGRALWRNVAAFFSYVTLYIGFIMAGFTERKQALHDKLAGTLVHRQPGSSAVVVIVIVLAIFFFVFVVGVLAAVAIPAYQDYTHRAKMAGVISAMSAARAPVVEHMASKGSWPATWEQLGPGADPMRQVAEPSRDIVESIRLEPGGAIVADVKISRDRGEVRLTPKQAGDQVEWACTSSPEIRKYVPASCR